VKVLWNDVALFTMPFQITQQNNSTGMMSARAADAAEPDVAGGQSYTGPSPAAIPESVRPGGVSRGTGCRLNLRVDR
jgi:hypothetical protein